jgi:hypothetical protein
LIKSEDENDTAYCTSDVSKSKQFVVTENLLNVNNHYIDGDYIVFEYSNYQNQICPTKTTSVYCIVELDYVQPRPVGVSLWIERGPDALQRIEKNNIVGVPDDDKIILSYEKIVNFIPNEWIYMDQAAIVTTKVRLRFESPNQDPNSDIVYLSNLFRSLRVTTYYFPY